MHTFFFVNLQWHQCEFSIRTARCPQIPKHPVCESKVLASAQHGSAMIISIRCPKIHQTRYVGALGKVCVPVVDMKNLTLQQLLGAGLEQFLEMEKLNTFEGWFLQFLLTAWVLFFLQGQNFSIWKILASVFADIHRLWYVDPRWFRDTTFDPTQGWKILKVLSLHSINVVVDHHLHGSWLDNTGRWGHLPKHMGGPHNSH